MVCVQSKVEPLWKKTCATHFFSIPLENAILSWTPNYFHIERDLFTVFFGSIEHSARTAARCGRPGGVVLVEEEQPAALDEGLPLLAHRHEVDDVQAGLRADLRWSWRSESLSLCKLDEHDWDISWFTRVRSIDEKSYVLQ